MNFLDLQMGDHIPDAKTIWNFKELIEKDGRNGSNKLFSCFHQMLDQKGLIAKKDQAILADSAYKSEKMSQCCWVTI